MYVHHCAVSDTHTASFHTHFSNIWLIFLVLCCVHTVKSRDGGDVREKGSPDVSKEDARAAWNGKPKGDKKMQKVHDIYLCVCMCM
jgi:hypothetical protein